MTGLVFNIERFAVEDGPGIRTVIFLKGCPLRCEWCANPESQHEKPEIIYYANQCAGCGRCVTQCPQCAIIAKKGFGLVTDAVKCMLCGLCTRICYYNAREISGKRITVTDVMKEIEKDKKYYEVSGGGITISGGEPLLQYEFVGELAANCKEKGISAAVESSLFARKDIVIKAFKNMDLVFVDIKHMNSVTHKQHTGVGNELILENIKALDELDKKFIVRVPFIPGFNSDTEVQKEIYHWCSHLKNLLWIEVLAYHRLALNKYLGLGRNYKLKDLEPVKKEGLSYLPDIGAEIGVKVRIGAL
jgi:pyruvate formate lyase activating enzyme